MLLIALSAKQRGTKFSKVRFGNILGSRGSVIPLFKQQIKTGGAVKITDKINFLQSVLKREKDSSTGVGKGVAIPHGSLNSDIKTMGVMAILQHPLDWDSLDGKQVSVIILIASPVGKPQQHLKALSAISSLFLNRDSAARNLKEAKTAGDVYEIITDEDFESLNELVLEEQV